MISVIIPVYNAEKYLRQTVASVQAQTFPDWELVLVDDGSKDSSLQLAEELCREDSRISSHRQVNAGVSAARNHGIEKSNADYPYALCLDSDDLLLPGALDLLKALLELNPYAPAACGFLQDIDAEGRLIGERDRQEALRARRGVDGLRLARRQPSSPLFFGDFCLHNYITTPGQVLIRKSVLAHVGFFDTSLAYGEDYDFWWRLTMRTGPIPVTIKPVVRYRHHGTSVSRNKAIVRRGAADFRRRLLTHPAMSSEQRRTARLGRFYRGWVGLETGLYFLRRGEVKHGFRHAVLGVREVLLLAYDMAHNRKAAGV